MYVCGDFNCSFEKSADKSQRELKDIMNSFV